MGRRGGGGTQFRYRIKRVCSGVTAHWRSRERVEGRWAAVVQSTAAVEAGRGERGRGRGRGEGGPPVWGIVGAPAPQVL